MYKPTSFKGKGAKGNVFACERGYVTVPEVRNDPSSNEIEIEYVRIKSTSQNPKTPIFYLAGGPGQGATSQATNPGYLNYWSSFLEDRDVVLIDQRGIGKLKMWYAQLKWPHEDLFVSQVAANNHMDIMVQKSIKAFERRGIDLNGYNSIESAHDIDAVRDYIGYTEIIPMGFSYGTHLGLSYLKYHEDNVERAILVGVEGLDDTFKMPLDLDQQFHKLNALIQKDSMLSQSIPDLTELYRRVVAKMEAQPITVEIETPIKLKRKVKVGKFGLDFILKRDMGDTNDIPVLPKMLAQIEKGDYSLLTYYVEKRYKRFLAIPAMNFSMDIASGGGNERIRTIRAQEDESLFGKINNFPYLDLHGVWPVKDLGEEFRAPIKTNVPVLLLTGDLDINTPSYQAANIADQLPNSIHLEVKNAGHEQIMYFWDSMKAIMDFMNGKDVSEVELSLQPIRFNSL
jgi:pimeloyl-ACP methyl ester carboxylesterase